MPDAPRRFHPVDALALLLALAAAATAWAFLFGRAPPPRPVDPLLGTAFTVEFAADLPWKEAFPAAGERVLVDGYLLADVQEAGAGASGRPGYRGVRLRILGREEQRAAALAEFRWEIWRGSKVWIRSRGEGGAAVSAVEAEVTEILPR